MSQARNYKRALGQFDSFFNSKPGEPCRGHFTYAVGSFVKNFPEQVEALSQAAQISVDCLKATVNGTKPRKVTDWKRAAAARYVAGQAQRAGVEVPETLTAKIQRQPAPGQA